MLITIHDKRMKKLGYCSNENPKAVQISQCSTVYYLDTAIHEATIEILNDNSDLYAQITEDKFISYQFNGKDYVLSISSMITDNDYSKIIYAKSLSLEMITETLPAFEATQPMSILEYLNTFGIIEGAKIVVGLNELKDKRLTLKWDGESETKLARLNSLVTKFGGEFELIDRIDRDGSLKKTLLNLYVANSETSQGVGTKRTDVTLYYPNNIDSVSRTVDKTNLYTAIHPVGRDGLQITSWNMEEYNSDGELEYVSYNGEPYILCPPMRDKFPSQIVNTEELPSARNYTLLEWSYDTDNVNVLGGQGLARLKELSQPSLSYEVVGNFDLQIGDTVTANDYGFNPPLLMEMRVSQLTIDHLNPSNNSILFDNFRALQNKLSTDIGSRLSYLINQATPYKSVTSTSNGTQFKNGEGTTTLTARVYKGDKEITPEKITWEKDGVKIDNSTNKLVVNATDVSDKSVYRWEASNSEMVLSFDEITITNVNDGEIPKVIINDDTSVTFKTSVQTETTPILKGDSTGLLYSDTVPTELTQGMLWKNTGNNAGYITNATYRYNGTGWDLVLFIAENIQVNELSAITSNVGTITAGEFTGVNILASKISAVYENQYNGLKHNGWIKLEDDLTVEDFADLPTGKKQYGKVSITGGGYDTGLYIEKIPDVSSVDKFKSVWVTADGIAFQDSINGWSSSITAETLVDTGNLPISASAPFSIAEPLTVRKKNGIVTMAGAVNINGQAGGTMFILPEGFRPLVAKRQLLPLLGGTNYGRVTVNPNGQVNLTANTANLAMDFGPLIFQV